MHNSRMLRERMLSEQLFIKFLGNLTLSKNNNNNLEMSFGGCINSLGKNTRKIPFLTLICLTSEDGDTLNRVFSEESTGSHVSPHHNKLNNQSDT